MTFGFVGKTFNLPSTAPKWMRQKRMLNKQFNRFSLPNFQQRQIEKALEGRGMYVTEGIQVEKSRPTSSVGRNSGNLMTATIGRKAKNPALSVNKPEVRAALAHAHKQRSFGQGRMLGSGAMGKSLNKK